MRRRRIGTRAAGSPAGRPPRHGRAARPPRGLAAWTPVRSGRYRDVRRERGRVVSSEEVPEVREERAHPDAGPDAPTEEQKCRKGDARRGPHGRRLVFRWQGQEQTQPGGDDVHHGQTENQRDKSPLAPSLRRATSVGITILQQREHLFVWEPARQKAPRWERRGRVRLERFWSHRNSGFCPFA